MASYPTIGSRGINAKWHRRHQSNTLVHDVQKEAKVLSTNICSSLSCWWCSWLQQSIFHLILILYWLLIDVDEQSKGYTSKLLDRFQLSHATPFIGRDMELSFKTQTNLVLEPVSCLELLDSYRKKQIVQLKDHITYHKSYVTGWWRQIFHSIYRPVIRLWMLSGLNDNANHPAGSVSTDWLNNKETTSHAWCGW